MSKKATVGRFHAAQGEQDANHPDEREEHCADADRVDGRLRQAPAQQAVGQETRERERRNEPQVLHIRTSSSSRHRRPAWRGS